MRDYVYAMELPGTKTGQELEEKHGVIVYCERCGGTVNEVSIPCHEPFRYGEVDYLCDEECVACKGYTLICGECEDFMKWKVAAWPVQFDKWYNIQKMYLMQGRLFR